MVSVVKLSDGDARFAGQRVDRTFVSYDTYSDESALSHKQKRRVETELRKLENSIDPIVKKLLQAQIECSKMASDNYTTLSQSEQFLLKKFIFVTKYRSLVIYNRYNHESKDNYNDNDKAAMLKYMRDRFERPIDVWFDNLMQIMTVDIEGEVEWCDAIERRIYPQDGLWLKLSMRLKYPVVCTPISQDEEFVLTRDAYSIHEGPSDDLCTTEMHTICVVDPRLVILMRDDALPELMDDAIEARRRENACILAAQVSGHRRPELATSLLRDMLVVKPRSTYTQNKDGQNVYSWSHPSIEQRAKTLFFPIFKIASEHGQNINAVKLTISQRLFTIRRLRFCMRLTSSCVCQPRASTVIKNHPFDTADTRKAYITKLEKLAKNFEAMLLVSSITTKISRTIHESIQEFWV